MLSSKSSFTSAALISWNIHQKKEKLLCPKVFKYWQRLDFMWKCELRVRLVAFTNVPVHTDPNWLILSNKYNPGQPIQKLGFWLSSRPFCIRTTFIWVHQGPPVIVLWFFFWNWLLHRILKHGVKTQFCSKFKAYNFTKYVTKSINNAIIINWLDFRYNLES